MSIDKLHEIVNKYNNGYHSTIQMKPAGVRCSTYIDFGIESNDKDHTFKFNDHIRISKCKNIFAKGDYSNWPEKFLLLKRLKILYRRHMSLVISTVKKLLESFTIKKLRKTNKISLELKKVINRKVINYMLNGKTMTIHLIVGLIKKISLYKMSYFPEPYTQRKSKITVKLD